MILVQLLKILPGGDEFQVLDLSKPVLNGSISRYDKSIVFPDIESDLRYQNVYAGFHVELIDKVDDKWVINVR